MSTTKRRWPLFLLLTLLGLVVVAMIPWFGSVRTAGYYSAKQGKAPYHFPKGFLWGTATAAQQVEHQHQGNQCQQPGRTKKLKVHGQVFAGSALGSSCGRTWRLALIFVRSALTKLEPIESTTMAPISQWNRSVTGR